MLKKLHYFRYMHIPLLLEVAGLLPSLVRRSHIVNYAPAVSLTRRLPESSMILGRNPYSLKLRGCYLHSAPTRIFNDFGYKPALGKAKGRIATP